MAFRVYAYRCPSSGRRYWKVEDRLSQYVLCGLKGGASIFYDRSEAERKRDEINGKKTRVVEFELFVENDE